MALRSFFQGAVNDIGSDFRDDHVRIHFHLRNEIMIGKKKANNVQFISQVRKKPLNSQLSTNLLAFARTSFCTNSPSCVWPFDGSRFCRAGR